MAPFACPSRLTSVVCALPLAATLFLSGCDEKTDPGIAKVNLGGKNFFLEIVADDEKRHLGMGKREQDLYRPHAWRYRDYVVRAFNSDKPYDRFIREQIAGDEIEPQNPEMIVATGFLRAGPWELTGMEVAKIARQRFLDTARHHFSA